MIIALVTLVATVPSLAEASCFDGAVEHTIVTGAETTSSTISADRGGDDGEKAPVGGVRHCAFSHCVHGVPATPPVQDTSPSDYAAAVYSMPVAQRLLDAAIAGPDHPPRV